MKTKGIIIGIGAPNRCRDGLSTQCAIGLSKDIGLFRIYPIKVNTGVSVWSECNIDAIQNPKDGRAESWKVQSISATGNKITDPHEKASMLDDCILLSGDNDPIDYQNKNRASVAVIKPDLESGFISRGDLEQPPEYTESEDAWIYCQKESPYKPYISWRSHIGKQHKSHLVAHEAYEWIRKNPIRPHALFDNMHFINPDFDHWFVMGNMNNRRNVWVVVHVHRIKRPINYSMLHYFADHNGKTGAWPYLKKEAENVKRVEDRQMSLMFITEDISTADNLGNMKIAI